MGGRNGAKLLIALLTTLISIIAASAAADAGAAQRDVRGTYEAASCVGGSLAECEAHPQFPQKYVIETEDLTSGALTGKGFSDSCAPIYSITGTISGNTVTMHTSQTGYTSDAVLTLNAEGTKLSGTFSDSVGRVNQPSFGNRIAGFPCGGGSGSEEEAAKKAKEKEEAEKAGKHVTGTSIICNYEFATAQNTCVASVGDGSAVSPTTPTGTVTFTTTSGGFANGAKCTLTVTSGSPTVSNCSLVYQTAESGLPSITATYSGDSTHAPSVGHTQFLGFGINEANFENPTGPSGHYPNEVGIETTVPVSGTTVEATAQGPNQSPGPVPLVFPPLPAGLDAESVTELGLLDGIGKVVNETGGQSLKDVMSMNADVAKILEHMNELLKSSSPVEQQQGQILQQDLNKTLEAIDKMLKAQAQNQKEALKNAKGSALVSVAAASKSKRTRSVKAVGYLVKRNVAAGKLKLHLRLGRAALAKLAGKRSRVALVVRIDMVMPSAVLHAGVPRVFVKRITLKRAPAGHHKKH
jgi:ElaB/YqjD/DUF883 family membrane-anchored ribosome-binding protein